MTGLNILAVDDELAITELIRVVLQNAGHSVDLGFPIWLYVHGEQGLFSAIFCSFHSFSSLNYYFLVRTPCPLLSRSVLSAFVFPITPFQTVVKTPLPWFSVFLCKSFHLFLYPDADDGILRLSIALRMSRNNSRGTATSAIWKITCRECRTTFAPILISFSRNVVNDQ